MGERAQDWMRQAKEDVALARDAQASGHHEWACFASHQAAEKALKALYQSKHLEGWGHTLIKLAAGLEPHAASTPPEIREACRALDKYYIPTRYPNGFASGSPCDFYGPKDSDEGIKHATAVIEFCEVHIG